MKVKLQQLAREKVGILTIFTLPVVSVGLLIETVPLFFTKVVTEPAPSVRPYNALQVAGRDIYVCKGRYNCHSQMIRPLRTETERYGHYSVAGESVYDHPFQWDSRHIGPDLARVGGCYSDEWYRIHPLNPCDVVPESSIPALPRFARNKANVEAVVVHMKTLREVGTPYSDEGTAKAPEMLANKSELDAVIAYLQGLGLVLKNVR